MARQPVAGNVKTRLARKIGTSQALRTYRTILARTIRNLGHDPRWQTYLSITPDTAITGNIWPRHLNRLAQGTGDLGQRMQHIFDIVPSGPVIIIGSDIPAITRRDIYSAFRLLGSNDVVFGPANDGGYWLVGARRMPFTPQIFHNIRWSSPHTLTDTIDNLNNLSHAMARQRSDLDTLDDYRKWLKS